MALSLRLASAVSFSVAVLAAAGCSDNPPVQAPPTTDDRNLMQLAQLYSSYQSAQAKKGSKSAAVTVDDLKKWAKSLKADDLGKMGITDPDVDRLFVSPRDNQPYQLAKPSNPMAAKMGAQKVIFYEKDGVNGKHMVVGGMGTRPREVTRDELKQDVPGFGG